MRLEGAACGIHSVNLVNGGNILGIFYGNILGISQRNNCIMNCIFDNFFEFALELVLGLNCMAIPCRNLFCLHFSLIGVCL